VSTWNEYKTNRTLSNRGMTVAIFDGLTRLVWLPRDTKNRPGGGFSLLSPSVEGFSSSILGVLVHRSLRYLCRVREGEVQLVIVGLEFGPKLTLG